MGYVFAGGGGGGSGTVPDGSVTNAKVASNAAIALSKLATDPLARGNHTGTQTAATISDLSTAVAAVDLSATYKTVTAFGQQAMLLAGSNNPQVTSASQVRGFARVDLNYTADGSTPDSFAFYYGGSGGSGGTRTGYHNEYGELRARPALQSTVALRCQAHASGSNGDFFQATSSDNATVYLGVSQSAITAGVPISGTTITGTKINGPGATSEAVNAVASSGTTETIPDVTTATLHRIVLSDNCTFTFPTAAAGKSFTLVLVQDATGSRTVTWPGTVKWPAATAPTLSTGADKVDVLVMTCADGTNWLGTVAGLDLR